MARQRETTNPWQYETVFVYAAVRAKHVSQEIAELEMRLDALKEEEAVLAELLGDRKAGTAPRRRAEIEQAAPPKTRSGSVKPEPSIGERKPGKGPTMKTLAVEVLRKHPPGLKVGELEKLIEAEFGRSMAAKSLSPQLRRLERSGVLKHVGTTWALAAPAA